MATPTPSLAGSLRTRPVAPLLVAILDGRRTGTLVVEEPNGTKSAVYFSEGAPAKAKTAEALIHVGSLLVEKGAIDQATHDATLRRVARERQLHGQILLDEGAVDEPTLHSGLKEQILRRVAWLFGRPAGALAGFYDGVNFLERWGGPELLRVSPLAAIWRGIRDHENPEAVRAVLASLGDTPLTLHEDADLAGFELAGAECDVCTALAAAQPLRLGELLGMNVAEPDLVNRLVHAFVVTRHLDLGTGRPPAGAPLRRDAAGDTVGASAAAQPRRSSQQGSNPVSSGPQASARESSGPQASARESSGPQASAGATDPHDRFRQELTAEAERMAGQSLYEVLGVPQNASGEAIQKAFIALAKKWHPDRMPKDLGDLRPLSQQLFSRFSEAHQTLSSSQRREEYDRRLKQRGGDDEHQKVMHVLQAATAFQKAEVLLKKRAFGEAETEARQALALDPDQADYLALVVWIEAQGEKSPADLERLIATLDGAVLRDENNEQIRYYRAQLLKRAGRGERAIADFRWIAEHNPRHVEAVRELRLYSMRHRRSTTRPPSGRSSAPSTKRGLIDKLFKR